LQEDSITTAAAVERLTNRLGRSPTVGQVAEHTGLDRERVLEALHAREARFTTSTEHARIDTADPSCTADTALLRHAIGRLSEPERRLITYRFIDGLTQSEIGRRIGISQPQVYRQLASAIEHLRDEFRDDSRPHDSQPRDAGQRGA
jgi:RNA polymerase sigma-B factor